MHPAPLAVVWGDNAQSLRLKLTNADALIDEHGNKGVSDLDDLNDRYHMDAVRRVDTRGPRVGRIRFVPGASHDPSVAYMSGNLDFEVNFDEELGDVAGGASLRVTVRVTKSVRAHCPA